MKENKINDIDMEARAYNHLHTNEIIRKSRKEKILREKRRENKRLIKEQSKKADERTTETDNEPLIATVSRINKDRCLVLLDGTEKECSIAPSLLKAFNEEGQDKSLLAVGDKVILKDNMIEKILPRTTAFYRKAVAQSGSAKTYIQILAANINLVAFFMPCTHPEIDWELLDTFFLAAFTNGIKPVLVLNKTDLVSEEKLCEIKQNLKDYGFDREKVFFISALNSQGTNELYSFLKDKRTLMLGISGAGKSTFLNSMFGKEVSLTGAVNEKTGRGNHTTAYSVLIPTESNGFLIDSPGVQIFDIYKESKEDIVDYLGGIRIFADGCKYSDCTHIKESSGICMVKKAVEEKKLLPLTYSRYLNFSRR